MLDKLIFKKGDRKKRAFYASDTFKPVLDLYFGFKGEEQTNPPTWYDTLKWGAGKGMEEALLKVLKDSDIVDEDYNQEEDGRIEIERYGVPINGYIDAITKDGLPIEIKSINNKNSFDIKRYESGEPRENYVGQLSIYMDALNVDTGYLFVSSIDGLNRFCFECKKIDDGKYQCGKTIVDIDKEYKKWSRLYKQNIETDTVPNPNEYVYKIPVEEIDWTKVSKGAISKARNGHTVIGDWQVQYSPWKDKIIEMQGSELGYSPEEIEIIKEKTKGFTTWK